ncbi:hypothetical protein NFJ02_07g134200 [Pycnococcus provasolii]
MAGHVLVLLLGLVGSATSSAQPTGLKRFPHLLAFVDRRAHNYPTLEVRTSGKGPRLIYTSHGGEGIRSIVDVSDYTVRTLEEELEFNGVWPIRTRNAGGKAADDELR